MSTRPRTLTLHAAATAPATVDTARREVTGLAVPFGPVGYSSMGSVTFGRGDIRPPAQLGRVKFLRQHDPDVVLGYAYHLTESDTGMTANLVVPASAEGDTALAEAADGRRDGLSVGVRLDDDVLEELATKWFDGDTTATPARGELVEISQVSLPAFADARIAGSAALAASLTGDAVSLVTFATPHAPAAAPAPGPREEDTMTLAAPVAASAADTTPAGPAPVAAPPMPAHTAATVISSEPPVYTFNGQGPSMVRDMWRARFDGDVEAQARVTRFTTAFAAGDPTQVRLLTAAVETRALEPEFIPPGYKPDLLKDAIDKGRPLFSRCNVTTLTDATPFKIPVEGDFTGVATHVEGTAHAAEGDQVVTDITITPGAISGAWRVSRELVDATNPAIDKIGLRSMMRNYRDVSEGRVVAALEASDAVATASINTVIELRQQVDAYWNVNYESPTALAASPSYVSTLLSEVDTTGRSMLSSVGATNALGTGQAGETGFDIDGTPIFKVWGVAPTMAYLFNTADVFVGESAVRTFRFEETEGPGIIKLALWAYVAAAVTRLGSVVKITTA